MANGGTDRRLLVLLVIAVLALAAVAPRINRWLARDTCRAQRGQWDASAERCAMPGPR